MKAVFVHDWFTVNGGAEKVAKSILELLGDVDIYCLFDFFNENDRKLILNGKHPNTSFLQHFPQCKKHYRNYLPLFPLAIESFDLSKYDLIISSSSAVAKSVKVNKNQIHVCYCHSPMRYIWNLKDQYIRDINPFLKRKIVEKVFESLPNWDKKRAEDVTHFIANSSFIAKRIKTSYNRKSTVLYPPIETNFFTLSEQKKENYFVVLSRLVGYKKVRLIVESFAKMPKQNLIIIGDGPEMKNMPQLKNVKYLGHLKRLKVKEYLQNARAMIAAAIEDFGISVLEAQSCGIPVLALKEGGYCETVIENETGLFFNEQTVEDIIDIVSKFEKTESTFLKKKIREHALNFDEKVFKAKFRSEINRVIEENNGELLFK